LREPGVGGRTKAKPRRPSKAKNLQKNFLFAAKIRNRRKAPRAHAVRIDIRYLFRTLYVLPPCAHGAKGSTLRVTPSNGVVPAAPQSAPMRFSRLIEIIESNRAVRPLARETASIAQKKAPRLVTVALSGGSAYCAGATALDRPVGCASRKPSNGR
jgi:hypothetical protein